MKYICDSCEKYPCDDTEIKLMKYCPVYSPKPKPQTNADRIRTMTDEELAKMLDHSCPTDMEPDESCFYSDDVKCVECWFNWLKQECES